MAFALEAPEPWASGGWKIKILDREWGEEPHFNFIHKRAMWRFGLRRREFMDRDPDPREVPADLVGFAVGKLPVLVECWDSAHPRNPVGASEANDE